MPLGFASSLRTKVKVGSKTVSCCCGTSSALWPLHQLIASGLVASTSRSTTKANFQPMGLGVSRRMKALAESPSKSMATPPRAFIPQTSNTQIDEACLRLQRAPPDFDLGAELNHEALAEAKAGKIVMIPQYEGTWFHLRAILRAGFEDTDPTSNAKKIWQAPAITETSGHEWLQGFLEQLEETPLIACVPKDMPKLEALLTKPWAMQSYFLSIR